MNQEEMKPAAPVTHTLPSMPKLLSHFFTPSKEKTLTGSTIIKFHLYEEAPNHGIEPQNKQKAK